MTINVNFVTEHTKEVEIPDYIYQEMEKEDFDRLIAEVQDGTEFDDLPYYNYITISDELCGEVYRQK